MVLWSFFFYWSSPSSLPYQRETPPRVFTAFCVRTKLPCEATFFHPPFSAKARVNFRILDSSWYLSMCALSAVKGIFNRPTLSRPFFFWSPPPPHRSDKSLHVSGHPPRLFSFRPLEVPQTFANPRKRRFAPFPVFISFQSRFLKSSGVPFWV